MTETVFLSGSRKITRLNETVRARLKKMIDKRLRIIVGDANGADKALQGYLADLGYEFVVVFCAGSSCRNNIGIWSTSKVEVKSSLKGRDFYAQKDKAMAAEADYGFVLWDGKSTGSLNNVLEVMKNGKPVVVYFSPEKEFYTLREARDVEKLLERCDEHDYRDMNDKIHVTRRLKDLHPTPQGVLSL